MTKLNLKKFDALVKNRKIETSHILVDQSSFDPRNLKTNDSFTRPAGSAGGGGWFNNGHDEADVIGKF